jgi:hypothetical protein
VQPLRHFVVAARADPVSAALTCRKPKTETLKAGDFALTAKAAPRFIE